MKIEQLIGDYQNFFSDLLNKIKYLEIDINGLALSHLLYRTATVPEYEKLRDKLKLFCSEFVETQFNGRAVAVFNLKEALVLEAGFHVSTIELPAPKPDQQYPSGLESMGVVIGANLPEFIEKYKPILSGVKNHSGHRKLAFITFDNDKTVKFYDISLNEIIKLQGWEMERI